MTDIEFVTKYVAFINSMKGGLEQTFCGKPENELVRDLVNASGNTLDQNNAKSMLTFIKPEIQAYFTKRVSNLPEFNARTEKCIEELGKAGYLRKRSEYIIPE